MMRINYLDFLLLSISIISFIRISESSLLYHHNYISRLHNLTQEYIKSPIQNVLDIGAFDGKWTNLLRKEKILNGGMSILIDGNINLSSLPIDPQDIRISEIVGELDGLRVQYYQVSEHPEANSLYPYPSWFFQNAIVDSRIVYRVDTLLQVIGKDHVSFDLVYLDIQGSELLALKGAAQTLSEINSGVVIIKVSVRHFRSSHPSFLDIQMEMYKYDFVMISILQYYYVTNTLGEQILTHMDVAWQRREFVNWLQIESWERRDYEINNL